MVNEILVATKILDIYYVEVYSLTVIKDAYCSRRPSLRRASISYKRSSSVEDDHAWDWQASKQIAPFKLVNSANPAQGLVSTWAL
jgi:hypothetical protein